MDRRARTSRPSCARSASSAPTTALASRNLGAVGVLGPLRMDYATAIASVREAAGELSRFVETVYER